MTQRILSTVFITLTGLSLLTCGRKDLTEQDKKIISELGYDVALLRELRNLTNSTFVITTGNPDAAFSFKDSAGFARFTAKKLAGLTLDESQHKAAMIIKKLGGKFRQQGYFIYVSDLNFGFSPDKITVLKTDDKFDLVRFEGTGGINYDIFAEDIIQKLSGWDQAYGLDLTGVGFDFIEADFNTLPGDMRAYANELYAFCPDIVDQGAGSVEELQGEIMTTKKLFLWWD